MVLAGNEVTYETHPFWSTFQTTMLGMKRDCGGAAAILGAFQTTVKQGFKDNLHAVICLAENSVGPKSLRPDDIITMYSGRSASKLTPSVLFFLLLKTKLSVLGSAGLTRHLQKCRLWKLTLGLECQEHSGSMSAIPVMILGPWFMSMEAW